MQRVTQRILPVALLALFLTVSAHAEFKTYRGVVERVVDGDTIRFIPDGLPPGEKSWSIRMINSDTAETKLPGKGGPYSQGYWGEAGHHMLESLLKPGEVVEVDNYGLDGYQRVLGRIFKRGNIDVNLEMVRSGWAALYVICDAKSCDMNPEYRMACQSAMSPGRGLFDPRKRVPQLPFVFRSVKQQRPYAKFVGNIKTRRYFNPDKFRYVDICDRVFFMTEADARREGFTKAN
jgi:2',3'-cyclic-nucleotide 2'-phosphodiesterase / 3'-nucleotidase / 5'-nucleotidase